jgi:hypothetical protein
MKYTKTARRALTPLIGVALAATFASSAAASFTGLERVEAESARTSQDDKTMEVECPDGKQLLSAAGVIEGGHGEVVFDGMQPVEDSNTARVRAVEESDYSSAWSLEVMGICADAGAGLVRVRDSSQIDDSNLQHDAYADCPGTKTLVGANADMSRISGGGVFTAIEEVTAAPESEQVHVMAREEDVFDPDWWVTAVATCAPTTLSWTLSVTEPAQDGPSDFATVRCPDNMKVTGAMGAIVDPTGNAYGHVSLDDIRPSEDLQSATVAAFETDDEQPNAFTGDWQVRATAICTVGTT